MSEHPLQPTVPPDEPVWESWLLVYLSGLVDPSLSDEVRRTRAARYATQASGRQVDPSELEWPVAQASRLASIIDQMPLPAAGTIKVRHEEESVEFRHPLCGTLATPALAGDEESVVSEVIAEIVAGKPDSRTRFLALWRLLPERLEQRFGPTVAYLPANRHIPDHSPFQRADVTAGLGASQFASDGAAFLSLSLGPVQSFIAAARTVRDLWSGSAILSWLAFRSLIPVLDRYGPTSIVFPALRHNPLMDGWLRDTAGLSDEVPKPPVHARRTPSLPNHFVALVPWGEDGGVARAMASACADAARDAWVQLGDSVRARLDPTLASIDPEWARRWQEQMDQFFDVNTSRLPIAALDENTLTALFGTSGTFFDVWPETRAIRSLAVSRPDADTTDGDVRDLGLWQAQLEASAQLMNAQRAVRHIPVGDPSSPSPPKCSLLGSFEQMGPDHLDEGRRFWEEARTVNVQGVRLRSSERFSAIALTKRFAAPSMLASELGLDAAHLRFPDTATIAATHWLANAKIDPDTVRRTYGEWNGRWLHQASRLDVADDEKPPPEQVWERILEARRKSAPPSYYAILVLDADNMGQWLRGSHAPTIREVVHPKVCDYFMQTGESADASIGQSRPAGPTMHASISAALNNFASRVAPRHVVDHGGTLIYSGGDDVLALLPASTAVSCAYALQNAFRGMDSGDPAGWTEIDGQRLLMMGHRASMSGGIAFVHAREDLRLALQAAREAEAHAKASGRNALTLAFMRRSGEHARAILEWALAEWFQELVEMFASGVTDRWAYRLRSELPTLMADDLPQDAIGAEIRRLVGRVNNDAKPDCPSLTGETAIDWWNRFVETGKDRSHSAGTLLSSFITVCQGASFVARGTDD